MILSEGRVALTKTTQGWRAGTKLVTMTMTDPRERRPQPQLTRLGARNKTLLPPWELLQARRKMRPAIEFDPFCSMTGMRRCRKLLLQMLMVGRARRTREDLVVHNLGVTPMIRGF